MSYKEKSGKMNWKSSVTKYLCNNYPIWTKIRGLFYNFYWEQGYFLFTSFLTIREHGLLQWWESDSQ